MFDREVVESRLAAARLSVAQEILRAENSPQILNSINELCLAYISASETSSEDAKRRKQSKDFRKSADEFFTILMCAMYNKMNSLGD